MASHYAKTTECILANFCCCSEFIKVFIGYEITIPNIIMSK
jgi:hypothetical protein